MLCGFCWLTTRTAVVLEGYKGVHVLEYFPYYGVLQYE